MNWANAFTLTNPLTGLQKLLLVLVTLAATFGAGYAYRWHQDSIDDAKQETLIQVITVVPKAAADTADRQMVTRLQQALRGAQQRADAFERQLKEYADAHPADPSCRLPERMRDQLNDRLSRSESGTDAALHGTYRRTTDDSRPE